MQSACTQLGGASRIRIQPTVRDRYSIVIATVTHSATDRILDELQMLHVAPEDVTLTRVEELGGRAGRAESSLIWADVVGLAGSNSRLLGRYLTFMAVAGVIACYGVIEASPILIVGAMAVSPDLLPITASAVGLIGRSLSLVAKALLTLAVGLTVTAGFAAILTFAQHQLSLLPADFSIHSTVLHGLVTIDNETFAVALAAGVAGMLAFETRASAGVGVAISVTTIPAAAYLGVAAGLGEASQALGALAVLGVNIVMMVTGSAGTLGIQRLLASRRQGP